MSESRKKIIVYALIMLFSACSKQKDVAPLVELVSENSVTVNDEGGEVIIKVKSNTSWNVVCNLPWVVLKSPVNAGPDDENIIIEVSKNMGEERKGQLFVEGGGKIFPITIVQQTKAFVLKIKSPSLLFTADEIQQHKIAFISAKGSLKTAYDNLMIRCNSGLSIIREPYTGTDPYAFYDNTLGPAGVIRNLAVGYAITGDERYGRKSIELMTTWANKCKDVDYETNTATGMLLTRSLFPVFCAYDILKDSPLMKPESKILFEGWFRNLIPEIRKGIDYWHVNDYFQKQDFQNHLISHTLGILAIGVLLKDHSVINFALNSSENPRNFKVLLSGCILMKGDKTHQREKTGSAPPENGEIYDRYRHDTAPIKGLQYSHLTLTQLTLAAKICYNNGLDMFSYVAPGGENLRLSFEYYSDFYRLKNSCIKSNYYCDETSRIGIVGDNPGMFEMGLNHYPNSAPIKNLIYSGAFNRGTDYMDIIGYTRLLSLSADPNL